MKTLALLAVAAVAALCLATSFGCVYTRYEGKDGVKMTRVSFFGNQSAGSVDLQKGTIKGYQNEQAEAAAAVVEAAVRAAVK